MKKFGLVLLFAVLAAGMYLLGHRAGSETAAHESRPTAAATPAATATSPDEIAYAALPEQAHKVLRDIASNGPFDYPRDGITFQNRERILPPQARGYYREYTVRTPGSHDRGARRIITGGKPPSEYYYSDDHYRSFRRITEMP